MPPVFQKEIEMKYYISHQCAVHVQQNGATDCSPSKVGKMHKYGKQPTEKYAMKWRTTVSAIRCTMIYMMRFVVVTYHMAKIRNKLLFLKQGVWKRGWILGYLIFGMRAVDLFG